MIETEDESIIYPPPAIQIVCDKTASFVAKNGPQFEHRIRDKELHNPKFCFLNPNDPYYKYYQFQIQALRDAIPKVASKIKPVTEKETEEVAVQEVYIPVPPPALENVADFPSISRQDLEIVKLTAQFVARNGSQFMSSLATREQKNYQFDFLRPSHSLYPYFTKLVDQFSRILAPKRNLMESLELNQKDRYQILDRILVRVDYDSYLAAQRAAAQAEADTEKIAFATIDWHDFVIVETIEFLDSDNRAILPPPLSILELESMTLEQRKAMLNFEKQNVNISDDEMEMDEDIEMEEVEEDEAVDIMIDNKPAKARYVPKVGRHVQSQLTQICVICKCSIKVSEMAEHVKIELLNPRYMEQRAALQARERDSNLIHGSAVAQNLERMANIRADIQDGNVNTLAAEDRKRKEASKSKVIWDGHSDTALAAQAKMQAIQSISKPIISTPTNILGPMPPPEKKQKTGLNPNAFSLIFTLPSGTQVIFSDLTPLWTVSQLKERLVGSSGMAAGKQKLTTAAGVALKNSQSLFEAGLKFGETLKLENKRK